MHVRSMAVDHLHLTKSFAHRVLPCADQSCVCGESSMTRGNQRETDRARAQAREAKKGKGGKADGMTPAQRNER